MKDEENPELGEKNGDVSEGDLMGLPYPKQYDGSEEFLPFLKNFNRIATAHNWTPPRCTQILPIYLRGSALAIYEGMKDEEKSKWKTLIQGLAEKLKKITNKDMAREKMGKRKQELGETVEEFAQSLRNLADEAYPEDSFEINISSIKLTDEQKKNLKNENEKMVKKFREEMCIERFKAGTSLEIKQKIIFMKSPSSLAEAVAQAKRIEELNSTLKQETRKRVEEIEVKEALAEVNQVWNDEYGDDENDEQYYHDGEGQWFPGDSENWGNEEKQEYWCNEDFCGFEEQGDQSWPIDETRSDED